MGLDRAHRTHQERRHREPSLRSAGRVATHGPPFSLQPEQVKALLWPVFCGAASGIWNGRAEGRAGADRTALHPFLGAGLGGGAAGRGAGDRIAGGGETGACTAGGRGGAERTMGAWETGGRESGGLTAGGREAGADRMTGADFGLAGTGADGFLVVGAADGCGRGPLSGDALGSGVPFGGVADRAAGTRGVALPGTLVERGETGGGVLAPCRRIAGTLASLKRSTSAGVRNPAPRRRRGSNCQLSGARAVRLNVLKRAGSTTTRRRLQSHVAHNAAPIATAVANQISGP